MRTLPKNNTFRGFTLIELMVSIALFSIVISIVAAAYMNLLSVDAQAHGTNDLSTNLNFAVDTMARSIRTGTDYFCVDAAGNSISSPSNCDYPSGGQYGVSFSTDQGTFIMYAYDSAHHTIVECPGGSTCKTGPSATPIINPNGSRAAEPRAR